MRDRLAAILVVVIVGNPVGRAAEPDPSALEFFEAKVRPVLAKRCYQCHAATSKKVKGGLRVDSLDGLLKGGDTGPAVVPGHPEASRLIEAVGYQDVDLQMPPMGKLVDQEVADLARWVAMGAPWPKATGAAAGSATTPVFDLNKRRAEHWSWRPVVAPEVPSVKDVAWAKGRIDRLILARLEAKGLAPAPPAPRRKLIRRITFDLIGLPPTPAEVEAFVNDRSANAFETVVDRLLASPHYGERWGRHWLDLVRYAETLGHEYDFPIDNAWRYRDYVIRAFNADVPYDQLVTEHIAGDLLERPRRNPAEGTNESIIGTGFYWLGEGVHSPVDVKQEQADRFDNRIDVLCKTFLGLTVSCARCHDHKFDAISTRDYYALYGFLKSSRYTQAAIDDVPLAAKAAELAALKGPIREAAGARWAERVPTLARYLLASRECRPGKPEELDRRVEEAAVGRGLDPALLGRWVRALRDPAVNDPAHPVHAWARMAELGDPKTPEGIARWDDLLGRCRLREEEIARGREKSRELAGPSFEGWSLEGQAFGSTPIRPGEWIVGDGPGNPVAKVLRGGWAHGETLSRRLQGVLRSPDFTIDQRFLHVLAAGREARINVIVENLVILRAPLHGTLRRVLDGDRLAWQTFDLSMWKGRRAYLELADTSEHDLGRDPQAKGYGPAGYLAVDRVVSSDGGPPPTGAPTAPDLVGAAPPESFEALASRYQDAVAGAIDAWRSGRLEHEPDAEPRAALIGWLAENHLLDGPQTPAGERLASLIQHYRTVESTIPEPRRVPAMADGPGDDESVFIRGNPKTPGAVVPRRLLEAIAGADQPAPTRGSGRLELARRLTDPANPFASRVMVNRVWHHLFGRGLVPSVDDFGALGQPPTHPELLDDLADRFVKGGWSVKALIREIVLSSTYQMDSRGPGAGAEVDPGNALLHRMRIRRLEGEAIRDQILAVSGRLDETVSGPSIEVHLTPFMAGRGRPEQGGPLDGDGRRSVYTRLRRNFLPSMMLAFDMPTPFSTIGRRGASNVPAQALILLNDPFVIQQAEVWARRVLAEPDRAPRDRIASMYLAAFARSPTDPELAAAGAFLARQAAERNLPVEDVTVWADLAHALFNVKEFIFLE